MNAIVVLALYAVIGILHNQMFSITAASRGLNGHFIDAAVTIVLYMIMKEAQKAYRTSKP